MIRNLLVLLFSALPLASAAQIPFIKTQTPAAVRNNYSGFVGMQFTVGTSAMNIASLGRLCLSGNSQTHTVKLVNAKTGVDVPNATAQINMSACTANSYQYTELTTSVQLPAGGAYLLVSQEVSGGDTWYDYMPVTSTTDASVNGPVYQSPNGPYVPVAVGPSTSWSYVPANFQYSLGAITPPPTVAITQPSANTTVSGTITIAASASASSGLTIASVQFELNGVTPIGSAVLKSPYQVTLNTTTLSDGQYTLTAVATDSAGNSASSAAITIIASNGNVPVGSAFVQSASSATLRNNFTGFIGMQFTVGSQPLSINALGRMFVTGNSATHTVKLVNASTGQDVAGGSVQISMSGGTSHQFKYQSLATPLTLPVNTSYYLVSQETADGDQWYDYGPMTITSAATVPGAIYSTGSNYVLVPSANSGYVPLSFLYGTGSASATHAPPVVTVTSPTAGSVSGTVTFSAQATAASGITIASLQLLLDGVDFGTADTTAGQSATISSSLVTGTLTTGTHTLTAVGIDSSGQSTTSAALAILVSNGAATAGSPLITSQKPGAARSNFSGPVGMGFQVAGAALTVTEVGRFCVSGNSQTHTVKLVQSNGTDLAGASASVSMAGCTTGQYTYGLLSSPVKLQPNTAYYLVSIETAGGDQWYDYGSVTATTVANVLGAAYWSGSAYVIVPPSGMSYVPVNLQYQQAAAAIPPTVTITAPVSTVTVSGTITLTANATAAAGFTIASVQFQQNGVNIGTAVTGSGPNYSMQLDTTTLPNSTYNLTAIATDSAGNSTTSAAVTFTVSNAAATPAAVGTPFITQQNFGAARNNFSGFAGMQFTVGGAALTVTELGRICVAGNTGTHIVKLVNSNGSDLTGGSTSVAMSGCTAGTYRYAALTAALTLSANTTYYLVDQETAGGDQWYDYGTVVPALSSTVNGPIYQANGVYNPISLPENSFVPLNFLCTAAVTAKPVVSISSPAPFGVISGLATVTATATAAPGLTIASVQFQITGINFGGLITGAGPNFSAILDTTTLQNGSYEMSAIAIDSAGGATFSVGEIITITNNLTPPVVTVTSPLAATTQTGTIKVTATAVPPAGASVASLQLEVDGQNFGAPCAANSCGAFLDTTLLPNGPHLLSALAIDSDRGRATAATVSITASNTVTGIGVLNGFLSALARNYNDWIGMQFTTGCSALSVNALGRMYLQGNVGTHLLKLVLASNGSDVPGGSATLSFTGAIANRMEYAPLAAPVTLAANTSYYLVSQESATGDQFYDYLPILTMGAVTVNGPAQMQSGSWITTQNANYVYGPLDFKFTVPGVPFPTSSVTLTPGSAVTPPGGITPAACNHVLVTGQSLAGGGTGSPPLDVTQPYSNLMLNITQTAFLPLVEGLGDGPTGTAGVVETIDSPLGNTMTRLSPNKSFVDVVTNAAIGGASYAQLAKGTAAYAAGITQLSAAKAVAQAAGKTYKVSGVAIMHGETDEDLGTTAAAYEADLVQWQSNYQSDSRAVSGQTDSIPLFIDQENSWTYSFLANPTVALGQLSAAEDNLSTILIIGPKYQYHYNDGIHMNNFAYQKEGEQFGKVMKEVLLDGVPWKPFSPSSITRSGNVVTAKFNVPSPPLRFDTSTVLPKSAMGFEYSDGSACSPFIVSVQITAVDTVTLTLSATPTGANEHLRYAITGVPGSLAGMDQPGSARGNLKDSDPTVSPNGNDLSNWTVAFDKLVTPP